MKTVIRKWLLARKYRQLVKTLEHLHREAAMNKTHQEYVTRELGRIAAKDMDLSIRARREYA